MRKEISAPPAVPQNLEQLILPEAYKIYNRNEAEQEVFLLADSGIYFEQGNENPNRSVLKI